MFDKEPFSEENSSGSEYTVTIVGTGPRTVSYGLHSLLNEFERHLENISTRYKYIALSWLLGAYAGIGSLLSSKISNLLFNHFIGISVISFVAFIGVSLIWHLDMNVYHRFWAAVLIEEVIMEEKHDFLLQSRRKALHIDEGKERVFSQGLLYLIANTLLIITMFISFVFIFKESVPFVVFIFLSCFLFLFFVWFFMIKTAKNVERTLYQIVEDRRKSFNKK